MPMAMTGTEESGPMRVGLPIIDYIAGQTLVSATCFGIGPILATVTGGVLYGNFGALGVFGLAAACAPGSGWS